MAETLHELAIQIQGDIDARFGNAIQSMTGHLKQLDDGVKSIADSKKQPDTLSRNFIRMSDEAGKAVKDLNDLNLQMKKVDGYAKQRDATVEAGKKLLEMRREVRNLEAAQKQSGTKEFADRLRTAKREASSAEKAYAKQRRTLAGLDDELKAANIDTGKLSDEKKRLAKEIEDVTDKSEGLRKSMTTLTQVKYAVGELRGHVRQLGQDLLGVGKTWLKMGAALGAGGLALYKISDSVAAVGDAAAKSAAKLHMDVEAFQELQYAANLSGVQNFDAQMVRFNASLAKMAANTKSGPGKELKDLGINAKQFAAMRPEKALLILADELNKIKDPAKRARAEMALFGESGAEMGAFLKLGSNGIMELQKEARGTGTIMSKEATAQAEAFNDARDKMKESFSGLKKIVGAELLPTFTETFGQLSKFFTENQAVVRDFAKTLGTGFKEALPQVKELLKGIGQGIGIFWDLAKAVTKAVGGVQNLGIIIAALPLIKPLLTIGKIVGSIFKLGKTLGLAGKAFGVIKIAAAALLSPIGLAVAAIAAVAGAAYLIYKYWEPIKAFFVNLWGSIKERTLAAWEGVKSAIGAIPDWIREKWAGVTGFFSGIWDRASTAAVGAKESIANAFGSLPDWLQSYLSGVGGIISAPFKVGRELVRGIIGLFRGDFKSVPEMLRNVFAGVKDIIIGPFSKAFDWVQEKWAGLKGLFSSGPTVDVQRGSNFEASPVGSRARGGIASAPALTTIAERGPEVVIPGALPDRSHGIANLKLATRMLGLGNMDDTEQGQSMEERTRSLSARALHQGPEQAQARSTVTIEAPFRSEINVYPAGDDRESIMDALLDAISRKGPELLAEWEAQIVRLNYGT